MKSLVLDVLNNTVSKNLVIFSKKPLLKRPVCEITKPKWSPGYRIQDLIVTETIDPIKDTVYWEKQGFRVQTYLIVERTVAKNFCHDYYVFFPENGQRFVNFLKKDHRFRDYRIFDCSSRTIDKVQKLQ